MQASSGSQRPAHRRSPIADPGPPPSVPARAMSPTSGSIQSRPSTSSGRSTQNGAGSRRQNTSSGSGSNPAPPLSQIEKSVTHLLVATKQLLETLTQWSRHQATDTQVSDVYVRLGYEFNIACRAFTAINVDTSDLGNVPELLRDILESTLSQEASVESLERYLPKIRDIIINLLHGLKRKQQKLRQKQAREGSMSSTDSQVPPRTSSVSSLDSGGAPTNSIMEQVMGGEQPRPGSSIGNRPTSPPSQVPPRMSSASQRAIPPRDQSRGSVSSEQSSQSSISSTAMQNIPVLPPYPTNDTKPAARIPAEDLSVDNFPPPPPPPKEQNAFAALQRGGELERRASRRYSQYQISKLVGASPNGVPMLPTQSSPLPNRGRFESRESMRAVQTRGEQNHGRQNSTINRASQIITQPPVLAPPPPSELPASDSSPEKSPDEKVRQSPLEYEAPSATLKGPPIDILPPLPPSSEDLSPVMQHSDTKQKPERPETPPQPARESQLTPDDSPPPPDRDLTIFLQYKTKVKKFVLAEGHKGLTMARLQLAFIEKFAWNTHHNGVDLPEIYVQDPISGVRHELEDMSDVKDRSVLVLNVEVLDEVKRHIDEGIGGLRKIVESVKTSLEDQQATIQRVSDRQQDTAKEMARLAAAPPSSARVSFIESQHLNGTPPSASAINSQSQLTEIQNLRRDLAVLRQTYSGFQSDIQSSMSAIRNKANSVKATAIKAAIPSIDGESGRAYVNAGKKTLSEDSDRLVGQVDDLQDVVEDLRKDVVMRGVRPLPRQLETVAKDISQATQELKKMQEFLKRERPIWTKIWEKELETVCNDREEMTMQEDLAADLEDDLEKAAQTFALVEQATKEQMKDARPTRTLNHVNPAADPTAAKEGMLDEVRALRPNHENRVEAIERAEKLRQKELESRRGGEFQKELGAFVEEGRLKKSGGFEEVERARKAKDDRIRREVWERMNGTITMEPPAGEASTSEGGGGSNSPGGEENIYSPSEQQPHEGVNGDAVNEI
ncbi:actin interacting protein 3-domain-containing protein [Xylogone sp. PMI_703]|nr:actin interacting protein 3-domain-containing protein [Xylogone sp. PMI_703]